MYEEEHTHSRGLHGTLALAFGHAMEACILMAYTLVQVYISMEQYNQQVYTLVLVYVVQEEHIEVPGYV